MFKLLIEERGLIKLIVAFSLFFALCKLNKGNELHWLVIYLLVLNFSTELINYILIKNEYPIDLTLSINVFIHQIIWFLILLKLFESKKLVTAFLIVFIVFAIINFIAIERSSSFNFYTFVLGSFMYLLLLFYESFNHLKTENLYFYNSNNFILIASPVLFFFGYALMFGFIKKEIREVEIFEHIKLNTFVTFYVNSIYYLTIDAYILRESKISK